MNKVVKNHWFQVFSVTISLLCVGSLMSGCSKNAPVEESKEASAASSASAPTAQPTGLVKNPVKNSKVVDVTQWMDQASTKTAAQIAQEEKLAKEKKDAKEKQLLDAKRLAESKPQNIKNEASSAVATAPSPAPKTTETKPAEPTPVAVSTPPPPIASAAPAPAPKANATPERVVLKLVNNVQPKFPISAAKAGVTEGVVSARVHIETDGKVSKVEILKANPTRTFEKEVISAVSQWKYAPVPTPQTAVLEFSFKSEQ